MRGKRPTVDRRLLHGKASNYINSIDEIQPGDSVVLACRVSGDPQRRAGNLADSKTDLRRVAETLGARVAHVVQRVGEGDDPFWLARAAELAERHGAKLLAETTSRFMRHLNHHSREWPSAQARDIDLRWLRFVTKGVVLVTVLHPDASWKEERAYQTRRGQRQKANRGGRRTPGYKTRRKKKMLPVVLRLHAGGKSYAVIEQETGVPKTTVGRWLRAS